VNVQGQYYCSSDDIVSFVDCVLCLGTRIPDAAIKIIDHLEHKGGKSKATA